MADLTQYKTEEEAQQAFLAEYCGPSKYSRRQATKASGVIGRSVKKWFRDPAFFDVLEEALKSVLRSKSRIREHVITKALQFSEAKLIDCFYTDPATGELSLLPLHQIPEGTRAALKRLEIGRQRTVDENGMMTYRDVLKVELFDPNSALGLLGKWTNIEGEEKRNSRGEELPVFTGLTLILPEKVKELTHADNKIINDTNGEVFNNPDADGNVEKVGDGE